MGGFAAVREDAGLGEEQREDRHPLLPLGAECAQLAIAREDPHIVEMRPEAGRPAFQVARQSLVELRAGRGSPS